MDANATPNPFPADAVATASIRGLPDYRETAHFGQARAQIEDFQEDFPAHSKRHHLALALRGGFGSGKTHLVHQLIDAFTKGTGPLKLASSDGMLVYAAYSKAERPSLLDLYCNHVACHLEVDDFRTIASNHLARLLRASTRGTGLASIASREVDQRMEQEPQLILKLLKQDLLPVADLPALAYADIRAGEVDFSANFMRAYFQLFEDHAELALKWIKGQALTSGEAKDLGLPSAAISTEQNAKAALRLLLTSFAKADLRFMLCIDEVERVVGGDGQLKPGGNFLKDVAEIFMDAKQCLVLSGVDKAWDGMSSDVFDRTTRVVSVRMKEDELERILDAWCQHAGFARESLFDRDALKKLTAIADGNPRRMLSVAHHAFAQMQRTDPKISRVSDANVRAAAETALEAPRRRDAVEQTVKSVAQNKGFSLRAEPLADGVRCDLLLSRGKDLIAVFIMNSVFKLEELAGARAVAKLSAPGNRNAAGSIHTVAIVTGYSTPEVRDALDQVVNRVFSYQEGTFAAVFSEFLGHKLTQQSVDSKGPEEAQAARLEFERRLVELEADRKKEIATLNALLSNMQNQAKREHEIVREQRSADKIEQTLDEIEALVERKLRGESRGALHDEWRDLLMRLALLNRNLPDAEEFQRTIDRLDVVFVSTSSLDSERELRALFRQLTTLHLSRGAPTFIDSINRGVRALRRNWLTFLAAMLAAAYVAVATREIFRTVDDYEQFGVAVGRAQRLFDMSQVRTLKLEDADALRKAVLDQRLALSDATFQYLGGLGVSREIRDRAAALDGELGDYLDALGEFLSEGQKGPQAGTDPENLRQDVFKGNRGIIDSSKALRAALARASTASILIAFLMNSQVAFSLVGTAIGSAIWWSIRRKRLP